MSHISGSAIHGLRIYSGRVDSGRIKGAGVQDGVKCLCVN